MRKLLPILALGLLAPLAWAGTDASNARGFVPGKVYDFGDFDSVNAFNGNLIVQLPMGPTYPVGPELDLKLTLTYNSMLWDWANYSIVWLATPTWFGLGDATGDSLTSGRPADLNNAGLGWRVSLGELLEPAPSANQTVIPVNDELTWVYVAPDGSSHTFFETLYAAHQNPGANCSQLLFTGKCYTRDGSYLRLRRTGGTIEMERPDGVVVTFRHIRNGIWRPTLLADRHGNAITVHYEQNPDGSMQYWQIKDNAVSSDPEQQRTITVRFEQLPGDTEPNDGRIPERIDKIEMEGPAGRPIVLDFHYADVSIAPNCVANGFDTQRWDVSQLTAVTQTVATGTGGTDAWDYHFTYQPDDTDDAINPQYPCSYLGGRLKTLELPTGGIVEYKYANYFMGVNYCRPPGDNQGPGPHIPPAFNSLQSFPGVVQRLYKNALGDLDADAIARWDYSPAAAWYAYVTPTCIGLDPWLHIMNLQYEMLGTGLVTRTESYYSIWALEFDTTNGEGWRQAEFGLPFTRRQMGPGAPYQDPDVPTLVNPLVIQGKEHFLSSLVFRCPIADRDGFPPPVPPPPFSEPNRHPDCEPERARYVRYEDSFGDCSIEDGSCGNIGYRVAGSVEVYLDDGATYKATELSDFDRFGNYRSSKLWSDLGAQFDPNLVNVPVETKTGYLPTGSHDGSGLAASGADPASLEWILGRYDYRETTEGALGTARTEFCFEGIDPASGGTPTGLLLGTRRLGSTNRSRATNDLVIKYEKGGHGFTAMERFAGGDRRNNADTSPGWLCSPASTSSAEYEIEHRYENGVRKSSWYRRGGNRFFTVLDTDVDRLGNSVVSRDVSGRPATFEYDDRNRTVLQSDPTGLVTTTQFDTPGRKTIREGKSGTSILLHAEYFFDPLGRPIRETQRLPAASGFQTSERCLEYMPNGRVKRESELAASCPSTLSDDGWTRFKSYDPFGNAEQLIAPDGKLTQFAYYGVQSKVLRTLVGIGSSGETEVKTKHVFDRRGRLSRLVENDQGLGGFPVRQTTYQYDVGGNLTDVTLSCRAGNCPADYAGDQTRSFHYDQRGLLLWAELPELGTSHHGRMLFERYDSMGKLGTQRFAEVDANRPQGFDIDFAYDPAGRPTQVNERATGRHLKEFFYATANYSENAQTDYRAGKLVMAKRWNPMSAARGGTDGVVVTDFFGYWDPAGRLTTRETRSSDGAVFRTTESYDAIGNVREIAYPTCVYPAACASGLPPRTVRTTHSFGLPTKIEEVGATARIFASSLLYHPNGQWSQAVHANGTADFLTLLNPRMRLTGSQRSERGGTAFFTTGALAYDGARNVVAVGSDSFRYDVSSQLVSAQFSGVGSQAYGYDLYGNLRTLGARSVAVDRLSNRLLPVAGENLAYDQAGNLTWYFDSYRYFDAFNQIVLEQSPGVYRQMLYNADDERVMVRDQMTSTETWSLRDSKGKLLRQAQTNLAAAGPWGWQRDHIFRGSQLFAAVLPDGAGQKVQHYHLDQLGTTRFITDANGQTIGSEMKHWPYGEVALGAVDGPEALRFTGHERDYNCPSGACAGQVGLRDDLDYMHARYFHPWTGRFLSVDSATPQLDNVKTWNRYAYAQGNPMRLVDPDGRAGKVPEEIWQLGPVGWWIWVVGYSPLAKVEKTAFAGFAGVVATPFLGAIDLVVMHPVEMMSDKFRFQVEQEMGHGPFPTTRLLLSTLGDFVEAVWRDPAVIKLEDELDATGKELGRLSRKIVSAESDSERMALENLYQRKYDEAKAKYEELKRKLEELKKHEDEKPHEPAPQ